LLQVTLMSEVVEKENARHLLKGMIHTFCRTNVFTLCWK